MLGSTAGASVAGFQRRRPSGRAGAPDTGASFPSAPEGVPTALLAARCLAAPAHKELTPCVLSTSCIEEPWLQDGPSVINLWLVPAQPPPVRVPGLESSAASPFAFLPPAPPRRLDVPGPLSTGPALDSSGRTGQWRRECWASLRPRK